MACRRRGVSPGAAAEPTPAESEKPQQVDWAALFKIHWDNRVKAFEEQDLALQNVVLLGDSITEDFEIQKYLPGRRVLNRGIGADIIGNDLPPDDPRGMHAKQNAPVNEFNRRLKTLAAEFGYDYVDLHKLMVDERGELKAELTEDGLHVKEPGYVIWRTEILRAMGR